MVEPTLLYRTETEITKKKKKGDVESLAKKKKK